MRRRTPFFMAFSLQPAVIRQSLGLTLLEYYATITRVFPVFTRISKPPNAVYTPLTPNCCGFFHKVSNQQGGLVRWCGNNGLWVVLPCLVFD